MQYVCSLILLHKVKCVGLVEFKRNQTLTSFIVDNCTNWYLNKKSFLSDFYIIFFIHCIKINRRGISDLNRPLDLNILKINQLYTNLLGSCVAVGKQKPPSCEMKRMLYGMRLQ